MLMSSYEIIIKKNLTLECDLLSQSQDCSRKRDFRKALLLLGSQAKQSKHSKFIMDYMDHLRVLPWTLNYDAAQTAKLINIPL